METDVGKSKVIRISRQPLPVHTYYNRLKTAGDCRIFHYLNRMMTNDARCTREIKWRISMAQVAFNKKKALFTSKMDLSVMKKLVKRYICSMALNGAEIWTLRKVYHK